MADDLWDSSVRRLADQRASAGPTASATYAERAARMASIDTGAIEGLYRVDRGFTITVAAMAAEWQARIQREKGPDVAALVGAQKAAYDMALDVATGDGALSEAWIRQLHEVAVAPQDLYDVVTPVGPQRHPLPKGEYKTSENHVELSDGSVHAYAPVSDTPAEMGRLVVELRSPAFLGAHPILQCSYAHYAFACIHPFADGNGRVARALASVYTFRATSLPFVVFADQKNTYVAALESADEGDAQAFVDFVLFRAVDLQQLVAEQLAEVAGTPLEDAVARLRETASHPEVLLLLEAIRNELQSELRAQDLPSSLSWNVSVGREEGFPGTFPRPSVPAVHLTVSTSSPKAAKVDEFISVWAQPGAGSGPHFSVSRQSRRRDSLTVRSDEVRPGVGAALQHRLTAWLRRILAEKLIELTSQAERLS
ncbi:MAG: Fic family protein [Acidimicrobiales bacterium]